MREDDALLVPHALVELLGAGNRRPQQLGQVFARLVADAAHEVGNLTRLFPINLKEGKLIALSFGRYNLLDSLDEDFFAGAGTERFFNIAQIGPLTVLRQFPLSAGRARSVLRTLHAWNKQTGWRIYEGMPTDHHGGGAMISPHGLFEVHLAVADLDHAITFYRDVLGLRLAHVESTRQAAFLWIGPAGHAMLGLWATGAAPQTVTSHTAFRVSLDAVLAAPGALRASGIMPLDFHGRPTDRPIVFAWMPAASVFFHDPDGHLLEYIAMLPQAPRAEYGIMPWRMWERMHQAVSCEA